MPVCWKKEEKGEEEEEEDDSIGASGCGGYGDYDPIDILPPVLLLLLLLLLLPLLLLLLLLALLPHLIQESSNGRRISCRGNWCLPQRIASRLMGRNSSTRPWMRQPDRFPKS